MWKYLLCAFLMIASLTWAENVKQTSLCDKLIHYPLQLSSVIHRLHNIPEARQLIAQVQSKGLVTVKVNTYLPQEFEAIWEGESRTIFVTLSRKKSEGSICASLIFELHNALSNDRVDELYLLAKNGKIDKETYVEQIERMEHSNASKSIKLIAAAIRQGTLPESAQLGLVRDFDEHYKIQQLAGHSVWIAEQFDTYNPKGVMTPYRGTIPNFNKMTSEEKLKMLDDLSRKACAMDNFL